MRSKLALKDISANNRLMYYKTFGTIPPSSCDFSQLSFPTFGDAKVIGGDLIDCE